MTAQAMKGDRDRCLAAGMDSYLSKPIRSHQVLEAIERATADKPVRGPESDDKERPGPRHAPAEREPGRERFRLDKQSALAAVDGDPDLLRDVAEAFLTEAPQLLAQAEAAFATKDAAALKAAAHTLKGAVSSFGAHPAVELALAAERAAKAEDLAAAEVPLRELRDALRPLFDDLAALLTTTPHA
jgi:HPt (histidine-containing phosphotransfer) domain-containing protein